MAVKQLKIVGLLLAKSSDFKWSWFYIIEPFACFSVGKKWFFLSNTLLDAVVPWVLTWRDKASGLWYSFSWRFCFSCLMLYSLLFYMVQCIDFWESEKYFSVG